MLVSDLWRVGNLIALDDPAVFGYAGAALMKFLGGVALANITLILGLLIWIVLPLIIPIGLAAEPSPPNSPWLATIRVQHDFVTNP